MANVIIQLEIDPDTNRKRLRVAYESDRDALPMEHEQEHRALVEKLLEEGLIDDPDQIVVDREPGKDIKARPPAEPESEREAQAQEG